MPDPLPGRPPVGSEPSWRIALRAAGIGGGAAVLLAVGATFALPEGTVWPAWLGVALGLVSTALGNLLLAASLLDRGSTGGARFARAMFADLFLHLVLGGGTVLALFLVRTEFLGAAAFALAFAASVLVMRITGAAVLSRALESAAVRRAAERRTSERRP